MRGIILAGGSGTRLYPITKAISKQLMPIYDKPMIYYPLSLLMNAGIREVLIITTPEDQAGFQRLLGDGSDVGMEISYAVQPRPEGLAQAFIIGAEFIGQESVALVLGDNIFYGTGLGESLRANTDPQGGHVFAYHVANPSEYGVVEFDDAGRVHLDRGEAREAQELLRRPRPVLLRQPGRRHRRQDPSRAHAGELEITAVNDEYLRRGELTVTVLERGTAWLDTGTHASMMQAAEFVRVVEERQGWKIGCIEEVAWRRGLHRRRAAGALAKPLVKSGYGDYLLGLLGDRAARQRAVELPQPVAAASPT